MGQSIKGRSSRTKIPILNSNLTSLKLIQLMIGFPTRSRRHGSRGRLRRGAKVGFFDLARAGATGKSGGTMARAARAATTTRKLGQTSRRGAPQETEEEEEDQASPCPAGTASPTRGRQWLASTVGALTMQTSAPRRRSSHPGLPRTDPAGSVHHWQEGSGGSGGPPGEAGCRMEGNRGILHSDEVDRAWCGIASPGQSRGGWVDLPLDRQPERVAGSGNCETPGGGSNRMLGVRAY